MVLALSKSLIPLIVPGLKQRVFLKIVPPLTGVKDSASGMLPPIQVIVLPMQVLVVLVSP